MTDMSTDTIIVPAGRGCRRRARRMAARNIGRLVEVVDRRGETRYMVQRYRNGRAFTWILRPAPRWRNGLWPVMDCHAERPVTC